MSSASVEPTVVARSAGTPEPAGTSAGSAFDDAAAAAFADEAAEAYENGLITGDQLCSALRSLHELLEVVYHDRFDRLQAVINEY